MPKIPFNKAATSISEQIEKLEKRGMSIPDKGRAEHYLRFISYYRLIGYGLPLEQYDSNGHRLDQYKPETSFEQLLNLYIFDRHLRLLVMDAIERIEVAVRTVIIYEMAKKYGSHWYQVNSLFKSTFDHRQLISEVKRATKHTATTGTDREAQRERFIQHYYDTYHTPDLPASWMIAEVLSLGVWSKVYEGLKHSRDRKNISKQFDLAPNTMQSWLHTLTYMRNLCAHHSRLYSRKLIISPRCDKGMPMINRQTFAAHAAVMHWFLEKIAPGSKWIERLKELMVGTNIERNRLGFDDDWVSDVFWGMQ
jgi:abortive infection bacteriophage resistance protein